MAFSHGVYTNYPYSFHRTDWDSIGVGWEAGAQRTKHFKAKEGGLRKKLPWVRYGVNKKTDFTIKRLTPFLFIFVVTYLVIGVCIYGVKCQLNLLSLLRPPCF